MRHHKATPKFHREKRQRVALMRGLARSLILHGAITTTAAKAKALRPFVERLVTTAKTDTVASRRLVSSRLGSPEAVSLLFKDVAPRFEKRAGGYTRIIKMGQVGKRVAEFAKIEFVK